MNKLLSILCHNRLPFNTLFTGDIIKTLDDEQKESCEGLLTVKECKEALKNFSKNKSPGTDGLTAEFYSFFGIWYPTQW